MNGLLMILVVGLSVDSRVDSVIVYPDQVQVIRKANVTLGGSGQLVFEDLTGMLEDNSIRVRAPGLQLGEVQVKPGYAAEPTGLVKTLQDSLERLRRRERVMADEQDVLKAKEEFLSSIKLGAPEILSKELSIGRVDATSWGNALSFLANEYGTVKARQGELERQRKELQKVIDAVNRQLAEARAQQENRKSVVIDARAEQAGDHLVTLCYNVPGGVSWSPYYELRAVPSDQTVSLTYYARITQRTNEDWNNVKVILSTARPSAGGVAPEPGGWYLNILEPEERVLGKGFRAAPMAAPPGAGAMEELSYSADAARQAVQAVETGISLQYVVPGYVTLKSGEEAKKVFLSQAGLPAEFVYYTLPRSQEQVFLRGRLMNNTDYVYLAGQGNTYVGDEFTGKTYLGSIAPGESVDLSFGVDDRVKVKRKLVKTMTGRVGLLVNRTKKDFVYRTEVENYHSQAVNVNLVEQIPVAQNREIKVTVTTLEPKPVEENRDLGTFTYRFELPSKQAYVVNLAYSVEYPTGKRITGLY